MEQKYGIYLALVIGVLLIVGAVLYGNGGNGRNLFGSASDRDSLLPSTTKKVEIPAVTAADHLRGSIKAPVTIIEYSDLECPFCKRFHDTVAQAMSDYNGGEEIKLAWVFRHFPLESLHSKAIGEAIATECAAELGGNDGFWNYLDKVFKVTPSNDGLDISLLPVLAQEVGLDRAKFENCLKSNNYRTKIDAQIAEAAKAGGEGTPFVIVQNQAGKQVVLPGAVSLTDLKKTIDGLLAD